MSQDLEIKKSNAADLRGKEFNKWTVIGLPYRKNKRNSVKYTLNGVTKTQADWARSLGVASNTLSGRVRKYGVEKALTAKRGKHLC